MALPPILGPGVRRTLALGAVAGVGLTSYAAWEARQYTLRRVTVPVLPPGHAPLKVLHLSDIHMAPDQRAKQEWLRGLAALEPDLVVNTGDNLAHVRETLGRDLSGGERRRLEMARALARKPKVLLLDEPFAGVDPIATAEIRGFVRGVCRAGIGVLLTDHNVRETLKICDRAYLISQGEIVLHGAPETIVADPMARKTYLGEDFHL